MFTRLRGEWDYRVPADAAGRAELRRLCEDAARFHDSFLAEAQADSDTVDPPR